MVDVHRLAQAWQARDAFPIRQEVRIVGDTAQVGLEQAMIGGVKPDQRHEQANVGFGETTPEQEIAGQAVLQPVELQRSPPPLFVGGVWLDAKPAL